MEERYSHNMPLRGEECYEPYHCRSKPCKIYPAVQTLQDKNASYEVRPKTSRAGQVIDWVDLYSFVLINSETGQIITKRIAMDKE
jgi:hypothetical protein